MSGIAAPLGILAVAGAVALALGEGMPRRAVMLSAAVIAAGWIVARLAVGANAISQFAEREGTGEYVAPLVKGVGIAWATALTSLILGELGEKGAADVARLAGAAELCVLAIPLASKLVASALSLV